MTSNRVGTFDEGFRSRIQLALHYDKLTQTSRLRVWENFIDRLESFKLANINIHDIRKHLIELSSIELNGREIRNAVTTARQLAMFKNKPLDFDCLKHVIEVSGSFDRYLKDVNEGMSADELAREYRIRG